MHHPLRHRSDLERLREGGSFPRGHPLTDLRYVAERFGHEANVHSCQEKTSACSEPRSIWCYTKEVIVFVSKLRLSFLLVALLVTLSATTAWARQCSLETVKGTNVAFEQGEFVRAIPPLFPQGPFVNTANATFDGAGHFSGEYIAVIGDGTVRIGEFSGTYTVGSDCTYSDDFTVTTGVPFPVTLHHKGFITGEGTLQEVHYVYIDGIAVVSGTLKKQ
jgi:hypothetical protein